MNLSVQRRLRLRLCCCGRVVVIIFAMSGFTLSGCSEGTPNRASSELPSRPSPSEGVHVTTPTQPAVDRLPVPDRLPSSPSPPQDILRALEAIQVRQKCNRVMGCAVGDELVSAGVTAIGPIIELLSKTNENEHFWPKLVRVLGKIGSQDAAPFLRLHARSQELAVRSEVLIALGRIRDEASSSLLKKFVESTESTVTDRDRISALYSLIRLGDATYRPMLARYVGTFAAARQNPMDTTLVMELTLELDMRECLPDYRALADHENVFVREQAVLNMSVMVHPQNVPAFIARLDDELPATRRTALAALQATTGKGFTTAEQWKQWCQETRCSVEKPRD